MSNKRKRPQAAKVNTRRSDSHQAAVIDLRQGSRTTPISAGNVYKRKPKYGTWE